MSLVVKPNVFSWLNTRVRILGVSVFVVVAASVAVLVDASLRIKKAQISSQRVREVTPWLGPEIAIYSASRWLRHPTRTEPWAASQDGPAWFDTDPAGGASPPVESVLYSGYKPIKFTVRPAQSPPRNR